MTTDNYEVNIYSLCYTNSIGLWSQGPVSCYKSISSGLFCPPDTGWFWEEYCIDPGGWWSEADDEGLRGGGAQDIDGAWLIYWLHWLQTPGPVGAESAVCSAVRKLQHVYTVSNGSFLHLSTDHRLYIISSRLPLSRSTLLLAFSMQMWQTSNQTAMRATKHSHYDVMMGQGSEVTARVEGQWLRSRFSLRGLVPVTVYWLVSDNNPRLSCVTSAHAVKTKHKTPAAGQGLHCNVNIHIKIS